MARLELNMDTEKLTAKLRAIIKHGQALVDELEQIDNTVDRDCECDESDCTKCCECSDEQHT